MTISEAKKRIETHFISFGRLLYRNRLKSLFVLFSIIGILGSQISKIAVDTSTEAMFQKDDPSLLAYNDFRDQFGRDEAIIISIKSPSGVFNAGFLEKLKSFHHSLEKEVPYVKKVDSLITARNTYSKDDVLYVEPLLKDWPEINYNMETLRSEAMKSPHYKNYILSEDGLVTAVIVETKAFVEENASERRCLSEKETRKVVDAIHHIMARYGCTDFSMALSGSPVIIDSFNRTTMKDMIITCSVCLFGIIFFLIILFRRLSGLIIPLIIIDSALFSTIGLMAIFKEPFSLTTNAIVPFLLAVSVVDAVHILAIFYMKFNQGQSKEDAISYSLGHSGLAVVLTSITTAAGLLSFSFSELSSIANMGIYAAVGVMLAVAYTILLIPPFLALIPIKQKKQDQNQSSPMEKFLLSCGYFSTGHPKKILAAGILIFAVSFVSIYHLRFSHDVMDYFSEDVPVKRDALFIDHELKGMTSLEVVVDTKKENGLYEPNILNSIDQFTDHVEKINNSQIFVGKVFSINNILKETHKALNGNDPSFYKIPQDRKTIAQELFLFELSGSDDLERLADIQFSKARISIKTPFVDGMIYRKFIEDIKKKLCSLFKDNISFTITGAMALTADIIPKALSSMSKSYIIAFIGITPLMVLLVGDIKLGLLSMVPNLLPIIFVMGIMGAAGVPLDMTTIMIGSIALGLVVDDTVHFMYNFQKYYDATGDIQKAINGTMLGTGRALLITSLILCAAFFSDLSASLSNVNRFGFFTGLVIIFALIADFVLTPSLLVLALKYTKPFEEGIERKKAQTFPFLKWKPKKS